MYQSVLLKPLPAHRTSKFYVDHPLFCKRSSESSSINSSEDSGDSESDSESSSRNRKSSFSRVVGNVRRRLLKSEFKSRDSKLTEITKPVIENVEDNDANANAANAKINSALKLEIEKILLGQSDDGDASSTVTSANVKRKLQKFFKEPTQTIKLEELRSKLKELQEKDNLERWLENQGLRRGVDVAKLKEQLDKLLDQDSVYVPKLQGTPEWQTQLDKMRALHDKDNLEKWLDSLDVPVSCNLPQVKEQMNKYFRHETFEALQGRSMVYQDHSKAKKMWDNFKDMHPAKQIVIVVGITATIAVVGAVSWQIIALALPGTIALNSLFVEVGAQFFLQRQEGAFHLLVDQCERTKPLSTAWANQYILWKYL